jgi:Zn-dependent alcohol dehydrogenase
VLGRSSPCVVAQLNCATDEAPAANFVEAGQAATDTGAGHVHRSAGQLLVRWFKQGKLPLDLTVTRRYRLEQINEACDALARGEIAGRAIVEF